MKIKNMIAKTLLAAVMICGLAAAYPAVASAVVRTGESIGTLEDRTYTKTQNVEYTTDNGETYSVFISSNSDESIMKMNINFFGNRQSILVYKNAEDKYEAVDESLFGDAAVEIAQIASEKGDWQEM